jgi:NhaP-type Na+/H+ or K+/H+ antiporter
LVFLPGLVFKDASSLSIHLFQKSIGQCLIFAFPMVLAGTGKYSAIYHK